MHEHSRLDFLAMCFTECGSGDLFSYAFSLPGEAGILTEAKAKLAYSWLCIAVGVFSGTVLFLGIVKLFHVSVGHGEITIAAPIFNLMLSCALIVAGRIAIGWRSMKW
jgi:hypothetical protein